MSSLFVSRDWVFLRDGHCIAVASVGAFPAEDDAWNDVFESRRAETRAVLSGVRCVKVPHEVYVASYSACLLGRCDCVGVMADA